jgi:uncharacterized protein (DUF2062 family)
MLCMTMILFQAYLYPLTFVLVYTASYSLGQIFSLGLLFHDLSNLYPTVIGTMSNTDSQEVQVKGTN